jgi:hypothetical protein
MTEKVANDNAYVHIMYMQLDCKYFNSSVNKMLIFPLLHAMD